MASRIEISKRLVLLNTGSALLARAINVSVIVWLHQHLLRRISPGEYQLLPLLTAIILLLPLFTTVLTSGIGRFVLAAYARGDDRGVTQIVSTILPLLSAAGALILAGGGLLAWQIDKVLSVPVEQVWDARVMMALLVFSAAIKPPLMAYSVGFYAQQKFVLYNVLTVCSEVLRVLLLFILLFGVSTRVLWVVVANVAGEVALSVVVIAFSRRMVPALRFRVREIRWDRARELLSFGGWSSLGYMSYRMRETLVLMILNRLATPMDVTVFSVGSLGRRQIDAWTDVMAGPLYPVVTGMHALGAADRVRSIYLRGGRLALWIMLSAGLPAALYAQPLLDLYAGVAYREAAVVMVLTLASLVVSSGAWMIWQVSNATGRVRGTSAGTLLGQVAVVILVFYAVRHLDWGASGVALASFAVSLVVEFLILWPLGLKLADATFSAWVRETLLPGMAPGCIAAVVWAALGLLVPLDSWARLGLCTAAGALCYLAVLLGFCLEPKDRQDLEKTIMKIKSFLGWDSTTRASALLED